jgi:hypothetical protein
VSPELPPTLRQASRFEPHAWFFSVRDDEDVSVTAFVGSFVVFVLQFDFGQRGRRQISEDPLAFTTAQSWWRLTARTEQR